MIHASGGDRHAPLTTHAVERDIIFPTPSIHPARAVDHQSSSESRLIVGIHPLEAKLRFILCPRSFVTRNRPKDEHSLPGRLLKCGVLAVLPPTWTVHHISTRHDSLPTEVPEEQSRCTRGNAIVDKQRIRVRSCCAAAQKPKPFPPVLLSFCTPCDPDVQGGRNTSTPSATRKKATAAMSNNTAATIHHFLFRFIGIDFYRLIYGLTVRSTPFFIDLPPHFAFPPDRSTANQRPFTS